MALLQYCPANEEENTIHYWKAKVLDPKTKREKESSIDMIRHDWVTHNFLEPFWRMVQEKPGQWIYVPIGNTRDDVAPLELQSTIECSYQQKNENFCLCYSLASALDYVGLRKEGRLMADLAENSINLDQREQIEYVCLHMKDLVPNIGLYQMYGNAWDKHKKRKKNEVTVPHLVQRHTPYPTIVVPLGLDGSISHAVTIVDDLIFDSTQKFALTLGFKSFHWICGGQGSSEQIWGAIRFQ